MISSLGPKYGKILNDIRKALAELDGNAAMEQLNNLGYLKLNVAGQEIDLGRMTCLLIWPRLKDMLQTATHR